MRILLALVPLFILVSCAPDTEWSLHEVSLFGAEYSRISYFYGMPGELDLGGKTVTLERAGGRSTEPLAVSAALRVNDEPYLLEPLLRLTRAPNEVARVAGSSDLRVRVGQDSAQIVYFDGELWFTLREDARAGENVRVVPRQRLSGLQGLGELSRAEAAALQKHIESGGPTIVTVLDEIPSSARAVSGLTEYLRTGLYLQRQIASLADTSLPVGSDVVYDLLGSGNQAAGVEEASWQLIGSQEELRILWRQLHASQLTVPPTPEVDFTRNTVLALLAGSKASGGYGVELGRITDQKGDLYADVRLTEPAAGEFSTQALTSPWLLARILRPEVKTVWLRDVDSREVIGVALP